MQGNKNKRSAVVVFAAAVFVILILCGVVSCPFYRLTGLKCPGCGITRMFLSLARMDFKTAFFYNPVIFCLLPVWTVCVFVKLVLQKYSKAFENIVVYGSIVILLVFGILRNFFPLGFPG